MLVWCSKFHGSTLLKMGSYSYSAYRKQPSFWRYRLWPHENFNRTVRRRHPLTMARARPALAMTDHSMLLLEALTDLGHATVLAMQLDSANISQPLLRPVFVTKRDVQKAADHQHHDIFGPIGETGCRRRHCVVKRARFCLIVHIKCCDGINNHDSIALRKA